MSSYWTYLTLGQARLLEMGAGHTNLPNKKLDALEARGFVRVTRGKRSAWYFVTEEGQLALLQANTLSE